MSKRLVKLEEIHIGLKVMPNLNDDGQWCWDKQGLDHTGNPLVGIILDKDDLSSGSVWCDVRWSDGSEASYNISKHTSDLIHASSYKEEISKTIKLTI